MITLEQIRKDLREIRYYYANEKAFQSMAKSVGESSVVEKVGRYNGVIRKAPAKLYVCSLLAIRVKIQTRLNLRL